MSTKEYLKHLTQRVSQMERGFGGKTSKSVVEGSSWIDINKDLVVNGYLVASRCLPKKLTMTNEHKQILSTKLSDWIIGTENQLNVIDNNGGVILKCAQDINTTSSPEFNMVKVKNNPTEQNDVTTKKYVDSVLQNIGPQELNMCSRISVVNPNGDCMRIGRNEGVFVDINVDADGTLNLTNEKPTGVTNDIDIYGQRINLLSNVETTSPDSGSLVIYGGVGIIKDLQLGGGLFLRTEEGIPTKLDFFEEGSFPIMWDGIWTDPLDCLLQYQRIGSFITLMIPYTAGRASHSGYIENTIDTYLPKRLRPIYDIKTTIDGSDNDIETQLQVIVYGDDGRIKILPKVNKQYSGEGISGFGTFCISYMADTKKQLPQ